METNQEVDESHLRFAEEELKEIDKSFSAGELNAFGNKESLVLKSIDTISQLQVKAFLSSMKIELK